VKIKFTDFCCEYSNLVTISGSEVRRLHS